MSINNPTIERLIADITRNQRAIEALQSQEAGGSGSGFATTELDNLGTTAVNADILPDTTNAYDLGGLGAAWAEVVATKHIAEQFRAYYAYAQYYPNVSGAAITKGDVLVLTSDATYGRGVTTTTTEGTTTSTDTTTTTEGDG